MEGIFTFWEMIQPNVHWCQLGWMIISYGISSINWAPTCDFQQCGNLIRVDSEEPLQPPFELRHSKWYSFSSLTLIEYSSDLHRLWSDCAYAQADLRLCWLHIPHCCKSYVMAQTILYWLDEGTKVSVCNMLKNNLLRLKKWNLATDYRILRCKICTFSTPKILLKLRCLDYRRR